MIITGWHSCKYSIFYLYSSSRTQPWGNCYCCFVPPRRERRGPRPARREDRPVAAGGGVTPGHMARRAGLTRTTVCVGGLALPSRARMTRGRSSGVNARGWGIRQLRGRPPGGGARDQLWPERRRKDAGHGCPRRERERTVRESIKRTWIRKMEDTTT